MARASRRGEGHQGEERPRLVIADDHPIVVQGLRQIVRRHFDIVGVAYGGDELLRLLKAVAADVLLLDLSLPGRNGLELLPDILALQPGLRVLVVTMHVDRVAADAALAAGAMGFVPKQCDRAELLGAIRAVLDGRRYVSPQVPKHTARAPLDSVHPALANLTPRQQAVVRLIGKGKRSAEIAEQLGITESAVTFHRHATRKALGLDDEWALTRFAILMQLAEGDAECEKASGRGGPARRGGRRGKGDVGSTARRHR